MLAHGRPDHQGGGRSGWLRANLQLVVTDIEAARAHLVDRGVAVSDVQTLDPRDGGKFMFFGDPDGNQWAVQEVRGKVGDSLD